MFSLQLAADVWPGHTGGTWQQWGRECAGMELDARGLNKNACTQVHMLTCKLVVRLHKQLTYTIYSRVWHAALGPVQGFGDIKP